MTHNTSQRLRTSNITVGNSLVGGLENRFINHAVAMTILPIVCVISTS